MNKIFTAKTRSREEEKKRYFKREERDLFINMLFQLEGEDREEE